MKKIAKSFFLNTLIFLITFMLFGYLSNFIYTKLLENNEGNFYQKFDCSKDAKNLINGFLPNCKGRWVKKFGTESFDTVFSTDEFGRRIVFNKIKKSASDSGQVLFFGGSDVLGQGVDDQDTIANQFYNLSDFKKVKNYGGQGFGPQQTLELLQFTDITKEAPPDPDRNVFVFFYGDDHVDRAAGSWRVATGWGAAFPYYALNDADQLVYKGTFSSGHRYSSLLLLAKKIRLLDDIISNINSYFIYSDANIWLTAKMLQAIKLKLVSQYKNAQFYVVFSPITTKSGARLEKILAELNISFLDYSKLWNPYNPANKLPESHPSPRVYRIVAKQLAQDLKK